jgi:hypothetical protein
VRSELNEFLLFAASVTSSKLPCELARNTLAAAQEKTEALNRKVRLISTFPGGVDFDPKRP